MCDPGTLTITAMAVTAVSGGLSAYGQVQQGEAQKKMYDYQAALNVQNAVNLRRRTEEEKKALKSTSEANITVEQNAAMEESKILAADVARLSGSQKATIGALGVGGATAADILLDTTDKARLDQLAIRYNANLQSWRIREDTKQNIWSLEEGTKQQEWALGEEAKQYRFAGKEARRSGRLNAGITLLSTAASMAMIGMQGFGQAGTPAVAGQGGYGIGTPSGAYDMGTYTRWTPPTV